MKFFASLMNIVAIDLDRAAIARMAQMMFHLFANVFRSMPAFEE
jgi:hypothetical protein